MSRPETRASLRHLSDILEHPAPINLGNARHVRRLISGAVDTEAPRGHGGPPESIAAFAAEDTAEDNPAL